MGLLTGATAVAMIKATGGEVVTQDGDSTYGHFERVPITEGEDAAGYVGGTLTTHPSVMIIDGTLSNVTAKEGIGLTVAVAGVDWEITDIVPIDQDGADYRLMLKVPN